MKNDSMRFLDVSNNYEKVCDHGHYTGKYSTSNLWSKDWGKSSKSNSNVWEKILGKTSSQC